MEIWGPFCSLCVCVSWRRAQTLVFPSLIYFSSIPVVPSECIAAFFFINPLFWQPRSLCCSQVHTRIESPWNSWEFSALSLPLKWVGLACYRPNWTNLISFLPAVNLCQKLLLWAAILSPSRPIWTRQEATSWITTFGKTHHTGIHIESHTHYSLTHSYIVMTHFSPPRWNHNQINCHKPYVSSTSFAILLKEHKFYLEP